MIKIRDIWGEPITWGNNKTKSAFLTHETTHLMKKFFLINAMKIRFKGVGGKIFKSFQIAQNFQKSLEWSFKGYLIKILQTQSI